MAEDATALVKKIEYEPSSDSVVGFSSKLGDNGLPEPNSFPATSIKIVKGYFDTFWEDQAHSIHSLVAVPLAKNMTPYVLCVFGTSNRYTAEPCLKR